jgi:Rifampin ADP-ribosyl transferase
MDELIKKPLLNDLRSETFYHGTKADLQVGDLLTAGFQSNYNSKVIMNHIYFTALPLATNCPNFH